MGSYYITYTDIHPKETTTYFDASGDKLTCHPDGRQVLDRKFADYVCVTDSTVTWMREVEV